MGKYESYSNNYYEVDYSENLTIKEAIANGYQRHNPAYFCHSVPADWKFDPKKINNKINYVIATWSGKRRPGNDQFHQDSSLYLKQHLESLSKLDHSLGQITIAVPENLTEPEEFTNYLQSIPSTIKNTPIKILRRKNIGQSYGSYSDVFIKYQDAFDFYIFMEDDYIFSKPHFDQIMVQMFQASQNCGYLCSYATKFPPDDHNAKPHAAVSNGISSTEVLKKILKKFNVLPHGATATEDAEYSCAPQLEFSFSFVEINKFLYDYRSIYKTPFNHVGSLRVLGDKREDHLIVPLQFAIS